VDVALDMLLEVEERTNTVASGIQGMAQATRAAILIQLNRYEEAGAITEAIVERAEATGQHLGADVFSAAFLPITARKRDRTGFDRALAAAHRAEATLRVVEHDMADMAVVAARHWASATAPSEDLARATSALAFAWRHFDASHKRAEAADVEAKLSELARRNAAIPLGRWSLTAALGSGAMGEVWRARDAATGEEAAVKLLSAGVVGTARHNMLVENEIRAIAALDHPNIVALHDRGRVPGYVTAMTNGRVPTGSPFMALEFVEGTTLEDWCGRMTWDEIRQTLLCLLDALAHSHARAVLHLDVKPENVLVDRQHRIALTDFGIARGLLGDGPPRSWAGTPAYMAPEQYQRAWCDYGPWTDLYALGGLGWALATGRPCFGTDSVATAKHGHLHSELPAFHPAVTVPRGLEAWLRRLLVKAPRRRYRRAADAASALAAIEDHHFLPAVALPPSGGPNLTLAPEGPFLRAPRTGRTALAVSDNAAAPTLVLPALGTAAPIRPAPSDAAMPPAEPPVLPTSWQVAELAPPTTAGMALFALRNRRLVGRMHERGLLWAALTDATRYGRPRSVVLRGDAGLGRSRLAAWLGQRAHEVGAATIFSSLPTDADPIGGALARAAGAEGLSGEALDLHIDAMVADLGAGVHGRSHLRAALQPSATTADRIVGTVWLVGQLARFRTVVVTLDDAHHHPDAAALGRALMAQRAPIVLLLTAVDEPATDRLEDAIDALSVPLAALPPARITELVLSMLPLPAAVVGEIVDASGGNPHLAELAVQLLVERDSLLAYGSELRLRPSFSTAPPPSLDAAWTERIDKLVRRHDAARHALRVAAALGPSFHDDAWPGTPEIESAALDLRLLAKRGGRLAFTHDVARAACSPSGATLR
jgi:hypothetical protein